MTTSRRQTQRQSEMMPDPDPMEQEEVNANSGLPDPPPNWPSPIIIGTNSTLDHTSLRNSQQGHEEQLAGTNLLQYSVAIFEYLGTSSDV